MSKRTFGFGIIGTGNIAHIHAQAIQSIGNAALAGVYNINKDKADQFAVAYQCRSYATLAEMLDSSDIDVVCICTPSGMHLEPALECIGKGKHCLIEKPLEITPERCDRIIAAAEKAGTTVGVIFPLRFYEVSRLLKQAVVNGRFGNIVMGDAYVKWYRTPGYYQSAAWRGTWKYDGGGALMNQGIHAVDLLQWLMGPVKSVHAFSKNIRHLNIEVEDTVVAILGFANGALGTIACSTAAFPGSPKRIEILGTSGTAVVEENNLVTWQFADETEDDRHIRDMYSASVSAAGGSANPMAIGFYGHQKQIEDMIHALECSQNVSIDGREGKKSVEIISAIYESARTGEPVFLQSS